MEELLNRIRACTECSKYLEPNPVLTAHPKSKIIIIGQAPGLAVHKTNIPWNDKSGINLRSWMGISSEDFYNPEKVAIIPMGFCYPGKGKNGDLPPRKECAPLWHQQLLDQLKEVELVLLIGKYAQDYYLKNNSHKNLTETVRNYSDFLPHFFVLPHPSPRNFSWHAKNDWFKIDVLPALKIMINQLLK